MYLLVLYVLANILVSVFLEKSKYRLQVAVIFHAVAFAVVLPFVLIVQDGAIGTVMEKLLGDYYLPMRSILAVDGNAILSPLLVLEIILPIVILFMGAISAVKVVEYIRTRRSAPYVKREPARKKWLFRGACSPLCIDRIYIRNCVIRC